MSKGFSLVEMSVVLVIIALITGGILTGQSLIRAAKLKSIVTESAHHIQSVATFREVYSALPGDMPNATNYWGAAHTTHATCLTTVGTGTQTCNGDGDGVIGESGALSERYRFWQHLANAGLIEGVYTGVTASGGTDNAFAGENVPGSKLDGGTWYVSERTPIANQYTFSTAVIMLLGAYNSATIPNRALLNPKEMWNLDNKIDDGVPGRGKIIPWLYNFNCTLASGATDYDALYNVNYTAPACAVMFYDPF